MGGLTSLMSFFLPGPTDDAGYRNVRDLERLKDLRAFVEDLWVEYKPLADRHFRQDAKSHFHERFWEMYLAVALMRRGYDVRPGTGNGPDFHLLIGDSNLVYVEATAPGPGQGPDAVPEAQPMVARRVPEQQIILRLRSGIEEKLKQFKKWSAEGKVNTSHPYVIALNGRRIFESRAEGLLPFIVKAVFPFGDYSVIWNTETDKITDGFYSHRDTVKKTAGAEVRTDLFESDEYREISAVLYTWCDCANHAVNLGDEFVVVHNPKAQNRIPRGFFPFGQEYTSDDQFLHRKMWHNE